MDPVNILKDVIAYVEVRSKGDNRSAAVCRELELLGAKVESSFTDDVTHVVYKEGLKRTYTKAQKKGIPLVSVSWLESCKRNQTKVSEKEFAALVEKEPDDLLLKMKQNRRWKKQKSMQPCDFDEEVARSAERTKKQRKRIELANRFKLSEEATPPGGSPAMVLALDTQARSSSPFFGNTSRFNSPLQSVIPDTPTTPSMKERIEKMRREQRNLIGSGVDSPRSAVLETAVLQRRLFEKLAKDIFSVDDSSDEEDNGETTARVVAKLIQGLESRSSSSSPAIVSKNVIEKGEECNGQDNDEEEEMKNIFHAVSPKNTGAVSKHSVNDKKNGGNNSRNTTPRSHRKSLGSRKENEKRKEVELVREARHSTGSSSDESFVLNPMCANTELPKQTINVEVGVSRLDTNLERSATNLGSSVMELTRNLETDALGLNTNLELSESASKITTNLGSSAMELTKNLETDGSRLSTKLELSASKSSANLRSSSSKLISNLETSPSKITTSILKGSDKRVSEQSTPKSSKDSLKTGNNDSTRPKTVINRRKLFSNPMSSMAVLPIQDETDTSAPSSEAPTTSKENPLPSDSKPQQSSKSKKKRNTEAAEVSFLFGGSGDKEKDTATARRRSKRLSVVNIAKGLSSVKLNEGVNNSSNDTSNLLSMSDTNATSNNSTNTSTLRIPRTRRSLGTSMSVLYGADSAILNSSLGHLSRRSIDEFSLKPANVKNKRGVESQSIEQINKGKKKRKLSASANTSSECSDEKINSKNSNDVIPISKRITDASLSSGCAQNNDTSSGSDTLWETLASPCRLRHANSLIMESKTCKNAGRGQLSLVMTSLHRHEQDVVYSVIKKLGVFKIADSTEASTTHVVCGESRRTLNLLRAIAGGCWIMKKEWVFESLEAGTWLMEENYEMTEEFPAAKETRLRRQALGKLYKADLFSEIGPVYVSNNCIPAKQELVYLITICSGKVTNSKQRASIFLGMEYMPDKAVLKPTWVLDSIMTMSVQEFKDYFIPAPICHRDSSPEF